MKTILNRGVVGALLIAANTALCQPTTFTKITQGAIVNDVRQLFVRGVWADFNNDGFLDVFVNDKGGVNVFYTNNGNGSPGHTCEGLPARARVPRRSGRIEPPAIDRETSGLRARYEGGRILDRGFWVRDVGYQMAHAGYWMSDGGPMLNLRCLSILPGSRTRLRRTQTPVSRIQHPAPRRRPVP